MRHFLTLAALLLPTLLLAQRVDTTAVIPDKYVPELGYFQKAHSDVSDPRFMITDDDRHFSMGVGGTVHLNTFYDFGGSMDGYSFSPGTISIPVDETGNFGYTATGSNIFVKARATKDKHKLTAYLQLAGAEINGTDYVLLSKAYVSVDGLTIGKTYSFFMDLEAGPMTVDLQGPNTQISRKHNLIGYTLPLGQHWTIAAALEAPHTIGESYQKYNVSSDYNQFPDLAAHLKYRGDKGHIQGGMIFRQVSYWASNTGFSVASDGVTKYVSGYGFSLSGNFTPSSKLTFSAQGIWGKGISYYIQDLAGLGLSLGMEDTLNGQGYPTLQPLAASGGYASVSYKWTESIRSSAVYGICRLDNRGLYVADPFKRSDYLAANIFYYFSANCFLGMEYLYGRKFIYASEDEDRGVANRLNACLCYRF